MARQLSIVNYINSQTDAALKQSENKHNAEVGSFCCPVLPEPRRTKQRELLEPQDDYYRLHLCFLTQL